MRYPFRKIGHVQGAGDGIDKANTDDIERRPDGTNDQIIIGSDKRPPVRAGTKRNQDDRGQCGNFQKYKQIEGIAGHDQPGQSARCQQPGRIGLASIPFIDFRR